MKLKQNKQNGFSLIVILGVIFVILTILIVIYLLKMQPADGGVLDILKKSPPPQTNSQNSQNLSSGGLGCKFPDEIDDCYDNLEFETWVDDGLP